MIGARIGLLDCRFARKSEVIFLLQVEIAGGNAKIGSKMRLQTLAFTFSIPLLPSLEYCPHLGRVIETGTRTSNSK